MYKNNEKIQELKAEFEKLQESEDCKFAPDIDGFIDFLAEEIIRLEEEVDWRVRLWLSEKRRGVRREGDRGVRRLKIKK